MATVVAQMLALDFAGRYRLELFANTFGPGDERTSADDRTPDDSRPEHDGEPLLRRVGRHARQLLRLRITLRRLRPAVVHLHTCSGFSFYRSTVDMLVARWQRCRVVLHVHGAGFDTFHSKEPGWRRRLIAWSLARADCVIALSSGWAAKIRKISPRAKITIVENAVDIPPLPARTMPASTVKAKPTRTVQPKFILPEDARQLVPAMVFHDRQPVWTDLQSPSQVERSRQVTQRQSGVLTCEAAPCAGASATEVQDARARTDCATLDGPCRFLLLARMDQWKGIKDLLAACAALRRDGVAFELVLAGPEGTAGNAATLAQDIRAHGLEGVVFYHGRVRGRRKTELLKHADVYVQPSHQEGLPIALLEALAYGLPVIATGVGAIPEVIEDQRQGLLVPPHRPDRLAAAMRELAVEPRHRRTMSSAARSLAEERFSLSRLREDLTKLYAAIGGPCRGGERVNDRRPRKAVDSGRSELHVP